MSSWILCHPLTLREVRVLYANYSAECKAGNASMYFTVNPFIDFARGACGWIIA